jgi:hypothetical protein
MNNCWIHYDVWLSIHLNNNNNNNSYILKDKTADLIQHCCLPHKPISENLEWIQYDNHKNYIADLIQHCCLPHKPISENLEWIQYDNHKNYIFMYHRLFTWFIVLVLYYYHSDSDTTIITFHTIFLFDTHTCWQQNLAQKKKNKTKQYNLYQTNNTNTISD